MNYKLKEKLEKTAKESNCRHYWVIEDAGGPTSLGICKFCGAEKEFLNSWPDPRAKEQNNRVFELPNLLDVESDSESEDSKLEESSAGL
jgi:hypothetical protein